MKSFFHTHCLLFSLLLMSLLASPAIAQWQFDGQAKSFEKRWYDLLNAKKRTLNAEIVLTLEPEAGTNKVEITAAFPTSIPGVQRVSRVKYSKLPTRIIRENGHTYLKWMLEDLDGEEKVIRVAFHVEIYQQQLKPSNGKRTQERRSVLKAALAHEKWLEVDSPVIQAQAKTIDKGKDVLETAKNIHDYVVRHMEYAGFQPKPQGAVTSFATGKGDCDGYSDLFIALARAKGIPARQVSGLITHSADTPLHAWSQFYSPKHGWLAVDTLHSETKNANFIEMQNKYITLTTVRNDTRLKNFQGYVMTWWGTKPKLTTEFQVVDRALPKMKPIKASY